MPCDKCGSSLIFLCNYPTCPSCGNIQLVPQDDAVRIAESMLNEHQEMLMGMASKYDTNDLLLHAFAHCDHQARRLILHNKPPDLMVMIACVAMIKMILNRPSTSRSRKGDDRGMSGLVEMFRAYSKERDNMAGLEAGTHSMIKMATYDLGNLRGLHCGDFPVCPNEGYKPILETLSKHGILTEPDAIKKINEGRSEWSPASAGSKKFTPNESGMSALSHSINTFYVWFNVNYYRARDFAVPDGNEACIQASELKKFIVKSSSRETIARCNERDFEDSARSQFGKRYDNLARNFVMSLDNPDAFPLFLHVDDEVFITRNIGELYCDGLAAILDKREFDRLNMLLSETYENKVVPAYFEKRGYNYQANVKKKDMQIDGIAVSKTEAYVIEAKCWLAQKLIGGPKYYERLIAKIKGAIDGTQHELATGEIKSKYVPLQRKIEWVSKNKAEFEIDDGVPIKGMLVINTKPPIREYRECEIKFVDDQMY